MRAYRNEIAGGPHPSVTSPQGETAIYSVCGENIKLREARHRPRTEAILRGFAPSAPIAHPSPIMEVA